jgi:hypothetical protein
MTLTLREIWQVGAVPDLADIKAETWKPKVEDQAHALVNCGMCVNWLYHQTVNCNNSAATDITVCLGPKHRICTVYTIYILNTDAVSINSIMQLEAFSD